MINESKFIDSLKQYDISGLDFEPIDSINEVIAGTMRPFNKRGMNDNEFTLINLSGFEVVNDDTTLDLFNIIPPGPKEMERHRTHLVVGRYSQAIILVIIVNIKGSQYVVVQKRNPINLGLAPTVELFRDYIPAVNGDYDFDGYFNKGFDSLLSLATAVNITNVGFYWENTGVIGTNVGIYICEFGFDKHVEVANKLNESELVNPSNSIGKRTFELLTLDEVRANKNPEILNDLLSVNGLSCLFRYLDRK